VQEALLRTLLAHGAEIDRPASAGGRQSIVEACLANGRPKAAEFLAAAGAELGFAGAAGLGLLDVVRSFFRQDGGRTSGATSQQLKSGFLYACGYGRTNVASFLIEQGVDLAAHARDGQTALHNAVIGGHLDTVGLLLEHNAPLEVENAYGGTVVGQALWSAAHDDDPDRYIPIIETLVSAGAILPERHAPISSRLDEWLARHGSRTAVQ
jgi:hypothetical protein